MKKVFLLLAASLFVTAANAQDVSFGLKAGASLANLTYKLDEESETYNRKTGFYAGAFTNIAFSESLSFNPELLFSLEGAKDEDEKINFGFVNIPLLLRYNAEGFHAETGPQLGLMLSAKAKYEDEEEDIKEFFSTTSFAWAIGLGYKLDNGIGVGARYNLGLSNLYEESSANDAKLKGNVLQIGISYTLGKK